MDESKKVKHWNKIFSVEDVAGNQKRLKEVDVLLSELSSLKSGAKVYEGSANSVLFMTDCSTTKSRLKKEKSSLSKKTLDHSDALAF